MIFRTFNTIIGNEIVLLALVATMPPLFLLFYIYKKDRVDKEPPRKLALLFFLGCISIIPALILEIASGVILDYYSDGMTFLWYTFISIFFGIALVEEGVKLFFMKKVTWKSADFNCTFDGLVYASFVSLGFALVENVMYTFTSGLSTGIARAFTSIPGHFTFAIFMGLFYSKARQYKLSGNRFSAMRHLAYSLIVPTIIHGFYDFFLSTGNPRDIYLFIGFDLCINLFAYLSIRKQSKEDRTF